MTTWLEDMRAIWAGNPALAVISMRGRPHRTGAAAVEQARAWAAEAKGRGWRAELFAEAFANVLGLLAAHRGDPPADAGERDLARAVIDGDAPADYFLRTAARVRALAPGVERLLAAADTDADRFSAHMALANVAALLALPHIDILRLRQEMPPLQPGQADPLGYALQTAFDCPADDPGRREALLSAALELALIDSDHPSSAVPVLEALTYSGSQLSPATLRLCIDAVNTLTRLKPSSDDTAISRARNDDQAQLFAALAVQAGSAGLGDTMLATAAESLEAVLKRPLSAQTGISTALTAARAWMSTGRLDRADLLLATFEPAADDPAVRLPAAELEAGIRARSGDRAGATAVLLDALHVPTVPALTKATNPRYAADRLSAILTLIDSWPTKLDPHTLAPTPAFDGVDAWINEAQQLIGTALVDTAFIDTAFIDTALIDAAAPEPAAVFRSRLTSALGALGRVPHDAGAEPRPVREAAAEAEHRARTALDRGLRADAFDHLAGAARLRAEALDLSAALEAFDSAFALLTRDLPHIPYPDLVIRRLAGWPDRARLAALTALIADDPVRALAFAETGRAQAIAGRLGPLGGPRPDEAPPPDWTRFGTLWRHGIAEAAADLAATPRPGPAALRTFAPTTSTLTRLRRQFTAAGVASSALTPIAPPFDAEAFPARLAAADRPTAVLYSLAHHEELRFIRITADGVTEIRHDRAELADALSAVRRFAARIRVSKYALDDVYDLLPDLLRAVAPALEPILGQAVEGCKGGRLVWVPQGELAALPLHAVPFGGRHLCDTVAVMVAGSLTSADVETLVPQRLRAVAIRGVASPGQPPTEGAATLLPAGSRESLPESPEALEAALAGATLVHLACHGVADVSQPLETTLRLGFELRVADLFDHVRTTPHAAFVLGAGDPGAVTRTDRDEGVGIPAGLLAAGAGTVLGPAWPVSHVAAVGLCRRLIALLLAGHASPEALCGAVRWLRDATGDELLAELAAADHPLAVRIDAEWKPQFRASRPFTNPARWAAYAHWGAPWLRPDSAQSAQPAAS